MKPKNRHQYSRFTDHDPALAERIFGTIRILLKKPVFQSGKASWITEIPSAIKKYKNTIHHSINIIPVQTSLKKNENVVFSNF